MKAVTAARWRFAVWSLLLAVLLGVFFARVLPNLKVETDILALLPSERDDAADRAIEKFSRALAQRMIFLVGAPDLDAAKRAATQFAATLRGSKGFSAVQLELSNRTADQLKLYRAHSDSLLSDRHFNLLRAGNDAELLRDALHAAFTPAGFARPLSLAQDPLGLAADYLRQQAPAMGAAQLDGTMLVIAAETRSYVMVTAELAGSPFASVTQGAAMSAIDAGRKQLAAQLGAGGELWMSGTVQHADASTRQAQNELATFGTIETIAVMVLLLAIFSAGRPLALGALTMSLAFLAGMLATQLIFGKIHVLALVFGSSLIGGVIDYSIHFFADRFRNPSAWTPLDAYDHVGGAILLGLTTTLLGYLVLLLVPFPGLRQIAVFCTAGLIVGCGTVLCWYPLLYRAPRRTAAFGQRAAEFLTTHFTAWRWTKSRTLGFLLVMGLALGGLWKVQLQDDVRALQSSPPEILASERRVAELLRTGVESRYFLVRGASEQQVLENEERLAAALDELIAAGKLATYTGVTRSLPSQRKQGEAQALLAAQVRNEHGLEAQARTALGLRTAVSPHDAGAYRSFLSPAEWLASPASESYRTLWLGEVSGQFATIVTLGGVKDVAEMGAVAQRVGVHLVDRVAGVSNVLHDYRTAMSWLLLAVYLVAGAVLAQKFGWREVPGLLAPSAGASLVTLGLFGWCGVPVNLFTLLALWLVLGLGVDYGIFLRHGRTARSTAVLSVTLSATTTLLAFGMLAFSATPFIRSIGLTLLLAIALSWLFAMLSCLTFEKREWQTQ